jgi:dipeptidyl aminopeptidase/acylaminoacyl peptidase
MNKSDKKDIQEWNVIGADGRAIYGCHQKPEGNGPFPAVLFIHGGYGDNKEYTKAMLDWSVSQLLLREGFVVLSTDYRIDLSGKDIGDVVAAFQFVSELLFVEERKIAYFGDSHGAYLAVMAATRTNPFTLIHGWGVADMAEWYGHIKGLPAPYYKKIIEDFEKSLGGAPDQAPEAYRLVSPTTHVADIRCPILILHGDKDEEVPVAHANLLAQAIEKAGGEYMLKIFKDAGHGLRSPEFRKAMDPLVLEFLNRCQPKP